MIKYSLLLVLAFFLNSCGTQQTIKVKPPEKFIDVKSYVGFNSKEILQIKKGLGRVGGIIRSKCFSDFMLNRPMIKTLGKTSEEVLLSLLQNTIPIRLTMYYSEKRVVGYTYPNTNMIWLNRRVYRSLKSCSIASNITHETSHKLGYKHAFEKTLKRKYSVPYSINAGFNLCCLN